MTATDIPVATTCPDCSAPTVPYRGHRSYCFDCSTASTGETWEAIKARTRVTEKKAAKRLAGGRVDQVNLA